jgi:serine/threonine-protein kinase TTK/MPS1
MEIGESDLARIIRMKLDPADGDGKLDLSFTRYYWKEMLECVGAVHDHDIVHSDLKPANFLLVSGRLKLIDFGIANAIEVDHTVNVHRDSHIGTPNYGVSAAYSTRWSTAVPHSHTLQTKWHASSPS